MREQKQNRFLHTPLVFAAIISTAKFSPTSVPASVITSLTAWRAVFEPATMPLSVYQYSSLSSATEFPIRLLKLKAGVGWSPLCCQLWHTALSESPPVFEALSYVWGPPESEPARILVAEAPEWRTLPILSNLREALYRLRHAKEDRFIWVDALCINQSDHDEKSQQVPMMGKIYHSARSVIIWLGEEADDSDLALSFIPRVADLSQFDHIIKDQASTREWYALSKFMNRPWFLRRWVVQELAFAKEARLYCGGGEVDWALFADAATLFGQRQHEIAELFWMSPKYAHDAEIFGEVQALGALRLINALNRLFRRSDDGQILEGLVSLETLVTSLNIFRTKDPRDSIYAVMRLAENNEDPGMRDSSSALIPQAAAQLAYPTLPIDYNCPFHTVARGFVASCIKSSNSLDVICRPWAPVPHSYASHTQFYSDDGVMLSSWACSMDDSVFEIRSDGRYVRKRGDSFVGIPGRPIYQASKGIPFIPFDDPAPAPWQESCQYLEMARFPADQVSSFKAPRMEAKGLIIGIIQVLGERGMEGTIPSGWFGMANWHHRRSPVPDAFFRTLVADRSPDGCNPPSWYKRALEHALESSGSGDVRLQRMIKQMRSTVTTELLNRIQSVIWNRRFTITDRGAFGLVPANAYVGDVIMVLYGASVPVVLRKLESSYWLVGESYIHGAMDGMKPRRSDSPVFGSVAATSSTGSSDKPIDLVRIVSLR
jgi:Heterokaryon incompatibility protein (HET)